MSAPDCAGRKGAHTPGPWEYRGAGLYDAGSDYPFLWGWDDGGLVGCNEPVDAANIRLITASPELADCIHDLLYLHIAHHNHPLHVAARALLAKAEGRTNA